MKNMIRWLGLGVVALAFAACASSDSGSAPKAIEAYIQALVAKDQAGVVGAACAAYEEGAKLEYDSFAAVEPKLEGLACTDAGTDGEGKLVTCQGVIKVTYNGEDQELALEGRNYFAVQDNGEWRMCGYK